MKISTILSSLLIAMFLLCSFLYTKSFSADVGSLVLVSTDMDSILNREVPLPSPIKTLDDLVNITDGEITLKHSLGIPISGFGTITINKGTKITIGE
jgi:hypothetical protein